MSANWETFRGEGCLLNQTAPCTQGAVPLYTVKALNIADVEATVRFASKHNVRLVVKNTGHDYLGRSTAMHSISLWTHFMKGITFTDKFVPEGAPAGTDGTDAVILEAGVVWEEAYRGAHEHNRLIVGGNHPTVGTSGGFCQSGGHGPLSPRHGLCVDNVLQYKIVTADGMLRTVNAHQNQDLFWALRGGGPSYGVVVEAVYRTHPPATFVLAVSNITAPDEATLVAISQAFYAHQSQLSKDGWAGYALTRHTHLFMVYHLPDGTVDNAKATFKPFFDAVRAIPGAKIERENFVPLPTYQAFLDAWAKISSARNVGFNLLLGSRLIPRTLLESSDGPKKLAETMYDILKATAPNTKEYLSMLVVGGKVAEGNSQETSVHPGWRKAGLFNVVYGGWSDDTPFAKQEEFRRTLTKSINRLREMTPGAGTYMNEADAHEPDFKDAFFGPNYARLREIKDKYDPTGLFFCRHCVGSEDWGPKEFCPRCKESTNGGPCTSRG